jgi:preprotein translocase subunit YajC
VQAINSLVFLVLLMVIFYFMLIRPQKRRVEQHKQLLDSVGVGDEIVTIGGLHGTVRAIGDDEIELEVASGVTLRFVKSAVARRVTEELEAGEDTSTDAPVLAAGEKEDEA